MNLASILSRKMVSGEFSTTSQNAQQSAAADKPLRLNTVGE
jgi:hypothetical protein